MKHSKHSVIIAASLATLAMAAPAQAQPGTQYVGQITAFGFNFCPRGWASANGGIYPIASYEALFSIYGTTYGGDGRTTFGVPDLVGRRPIGQGSSPSGAGSFQLGERAGTTSFTLQVADLPAHTHTGSVAASPNAATTNQPVRNSFAASTATNAYKTGDPAENNMHADAVRIGNMGSGAPVNKVSPYTVVNWCVALEGIYPSRS